MHEEVREGEGSPEEGEGERSDGYEWGGEGGRPQGVG